MLATLSEGSWDFAQPYLFKAFEALGDEVFVEAQLGQKGGVVNFLGTQRGLHGAGGGLVRKPTVDEIRGVLQVSRSIVGRWEVLNAIQPHNFVEAPSVPAVSCNPKTSASTVYCGCSVGNRRSEPTSRNRVI
jgi:hypothetical protein